MRLVPTFNAEYKTLNKFILKYLKIGTTDLFVVAALFQGLTILVSAKVCPHWTAIGLLSVSRFRFQIILKFIVFLST